MSLIFWKFFLVVVDNLCLRVWDECFFRDIVVIVYFSGIVFGFLMILNFVW